MGICENVQYLCKKKNLPISHLEKELSLANGSIRRWNESSPSADKLQKVADYFEVSTDFLITGFDKEVINTIKSLTRTDGVQPYFPVDVLDALKPEVEKLRKEYWDIPLDIDPLEMINLIKEAPLSTEFKEQFLDALNRVKRIIECEDVTIFSAVARAKDLPVHDKKLVADMLDTLIDNLLQKNKKD